MNVCQVRYCGTNDMLTGVAQSESKQVAGWLCLASWAPVKVKHRNRPSSDNNKALHADGLAQTHDTSPEGGGGAARPRGELDTQKKMAAKASVSASCSYRCRHVEIRPLLPHKNLPVGSGTAAAELL